MKMNIMFDEQQAMLMALNISGNHVMCFNLKENRHDDGAQHQRQPRHVF